MAVHLIRFAGLFPKWDKLRKVAVHLLRIAGKATDGSPAEVSRFEPRKKVWLNLLTLAGEWPLIRPNAYGWCSPVSGLANLRFRILGHSLNLDWLFLILRHISLLLIV